MNGRSFSLSPFPCAWIPPDLKISGSVGRHDDKLSITCTLLGAIHDFAIPPPADVQARMDGLWEETCIELFLAARDRDHYWEFNLAPTGHWNVYRFTSYRKGMWQEHVFKSLPFTVEARRNALHFSLDIATDRILPAGQPAKIGIAAVMQKKNGETTYWALSHPGPRPDFHRRDSFIIEI